MKTQQMLGVGIVILASLSIAAGWWLAPQLMGALPARLKVHLPKSIYAVVQTPLPAALPAPVTTSDSPPPTFVFSDTIGTPVNEHSEVFRAGANPAVSVPPVDVEDIENVLTTPTALPAGNDPHFPLPQSASIHRLQVIAQEFNNCGPANLTMVLNYFDQDIDQDVIGDLIKPNYEDRNVSPHELVNYVNKNTSFKAVAYRGGDLLTLKRLLAAEIPVIIEKGLFLDLSEGWMGHYLTLTGYDDGQQAFISKDTFLGPWDNSGRIVSYDEVSEFWHQFNYVFIVVFPANREEEIEGMLPNGMRDPESMWQKAAIDAQEMLDDDNSNAFTWFNIGSSLTHLGELTGDISHFESAALAFDRARELGLPWRMLWYQFEPYQAYLVAGRIEDVKYLTEVILIYEGGRNIEETYLYRGHALLANGDQAGAVKAYQKAIRLNPSMNSAKTALDLVE